MFLIWHIVDFGWWGRLGFLTAKKTLDWIKSREAYTG